MGCLVSLVLSLFVAGAGLSAGASWKVFLSVFCSAALTHLGSWLKDHPVEQIDLGLGAAVAAKVQSPESNVQSLGAAGSGDLTQRTQRNAEETTVTKGT
jgi:hypothetical protein